MKSEITVYTELQAKTLVDFLASNGVQVSCSNIQDYTGWKERLESACYINIDSIHPFSKEEFIAIILEKTRELWKLEMKIIILSQSIVFYHQSSSVEEHIKNLGISPEEYQEIFPFTKHIENVEERFCIFQNKPYYIPVCSKDKTCPSLGCESSDKCKLNY